MFLSLGLTACSRNGGTANGGTGSTNASGFVRAAFTLPPSVTINEVDYVITGPTSMTGATDVSHARNSIEFVVGGLAAGPGYTITLSATDSNGDHCSSDPTPFTITAGETTPLGLSFVCLIGPGGFVVADAGTGSVEVDASVVTVPNPTTVCPVIAVFSVSPAEEVVGATSAVTATTAPAGAAVTYSVTSTDGAGNGTVSNVDSNGALFTCTSPGQVLLTVSTTAPLANDAGTCPTQSMSATIDCEPPACPGGEALCDGVCTDLQGDPTNCGSCGNVCPAHSGCAGGTCTSNPNPECAGETCGTFTTCDSGGTCGGNGVCGSTAAGGGLCVNGLTPCAGLTRCPNGDSDCASDEICFVNSCCVDPVCVPSGQFCSATDPPGASTTPVSSGSGMTLSGR